MTDITGELVLFLGGICALCYKPYPDGKSWTIHHRKYRKGEKTAKDFKERIPHTITRGKRKGKKTFKTVYHRQQYLEYLRPIVLSRPSPTDDFAPLHNSCHMAVSRLSNWKKENRKRLCDLAMEQE
jgi:hypothetical protein